MIDCNQNNIVEYISEPDEIEDQLILELYLYFSQDCGSSYEKYARFLVEMFKNTYFQLVCYSDLSHLSFCSLCIKETLKLEDKLDNKGYCFTLDKNTHLTKLVKRKKLMPDGTIKK